VEDALEILIGLADGTLNDVFVVPGNLNDSMTFDYTGPAFTNVSIFFALEADLFTIDTIAYTPAPEPMTLVLFGTGLFGLGLVRRRHG
jgi:hypothetical protein